MFVSSATSEVAGLVAKKSSARAMAGRVVGQNGQTPRGHEVIAPVCSGAGHRHAIPTMPIKAIN